MSEKILY